jgi:hypothetical protein
MDKISKKMTQVNMTIQMRDQGVEKQNMGIEGHEDGNGTLWLEFSMNIVKPVFIPLTFHYKFSSSIGHVYKEEKVMSHVSSVGVFLYVMKWLRPNVSEAQMSPIMVTLRWCVTIVMYILQVSWIGGDLSLNMSHNTVVENMLEVE